MLRVLLVSGYRSVTVDLGRDGTATVTNSTNDGDAAARSLAEAMRARNFGLRRAFVTIDDGARVVARYELAGITRCPHRLHQPDETLPLRCDQWGAHDEHTAGIHRWQTPERHAERLEHLHGAA